MKKLFHKASLIFILLSFAMNAIAESQIENEFTKDGDEWVFGAGLGILSEDEGYVGVGRDTSATPILYIESERFRLMGLQAEYKAILGDNYSIGLHLETRMDGFEAKDSDFLEGMDDRDGTLYAGLNFRYDEDWGQVNFKALPDVGGKHDGYRAAAEYRYSSPFMGGILTPWLELEYYSDKMTEYYYGVELSEARANRPAYQPDAAINFDLGIDYQYTIGEDHIVVASAKYRRFDSDIADSPIIEKSGAARALLAYIYRF